MKRSAAAVGLVIGLTFLTGCGVSVEGPSPAAAPASAQSSVPSETPLADMSTSEPTSEPTPTIPALSDDDPRRNESFDAVMGCPTGELVLEVTQQSVLVNQDCKKITIAAAQVTLFAEHVDSVVILATGAQSEVTVRSADSVVIDAAQADVYWEKGTPAKVVTRGSQSHAGPLSK